MPLILEHKALCTSATMGRKAQCLLTELNLTVETETQSSLMKAKATEAHYDDHEGNTLCNSKPVYRFLHKFRYRYVHTFFLEAHE